MKENKNIKSLIFPLVLSIVGIIFGLLMIFGVISFNKNSLFEDFAPFMIIFLSGLNLFVTYREYKKLKGE